MTDDTRLALAISGRAGRPARVAEVRALALAASVRRPVRQKEFLAVGVHRQNVADLASLGLLERVARGCYRIPSEGWADDWSFLAAATVRWPGAVVCARTAAAFHGLVPDDRGEVWLGVPRGTGRPRGCIGDRTARVREWSLERRAAGFGIAMIDGVAVRVVSAPQAVAELAELGARFGDGLAAEAAEVYLGRGGEAGDLRAALDGACGHRWGLLPVAAWLRA